MGNILHFSLVVLCVTALCNCMEVKNQAENNSIGILEHLINATMESLRPSLADLYINCENFDTGSQEFGNFVGHLHQMTIKGLDNFKIIVINTTFFNVNNLTVVVDKVSVRGLYKINGTLAFPLGKNDIHLFGNGEMSTEFTNFFVSISLKIHYINGKKVVKDLEMLVHLEKMKVFLKNLMGGGDLEMVFNQLLNDVGMTVFNYYKKPVLGVIKIHVAKIITEILNQERKKISLKQELS